MFAIDLLKGQGLPTKSRPEGIALAAVTIAVPVIAAIVMFSCYLGNAIIISVRERTIANYQTKINKLSDAVRIRKSLAEEKNLYTSYLSEVGSALVRHTQWSPILVTVVENLPDSVLLTKLEVTQQHTKKKVPKKDDPEKTVDISVPVRALKIHAVANPGSDCDEAVRDFRNHLLHSKFLKDELQSINVSQASATLGDQDVVSYEIDCLFKPPL